MLPEPQEIVPVAVRGVTEIRTYPAAAWSVESRGMRAINKIDPMSVEFFEFARDLKWFSLGSGKEIRGVVAWFIIPAKGIKLNRNGT